MILLRAAKELGRRGCRALSLTPRSVNSLLGPLAHRGVQGCSKINQQLTRHHRGSGWARPGVGRGGKNLPDGSDGGVYARDKGTIAALEFNLSLHARVRSPLKGIGAGQRGSRRGLCGVRDFGTGVGDGGVAWSPAL